MSATPHKTKRLTRAVVCEPGPDYFSVEDLAAHNITARSEPELALVQHRALREALAACGLDVIAPAALAGHPNCVFTQDPAIVTPAGYIQARMGLPSRRGEEPWLATALAEAGVPQLGRIEPPGTVEGGDVILAGDVVFVGRSQRTNDAGIRQLEALLAPLGYALRIAPVPEPTLHIGGMMSLVGPRQVLACEESFPPGFFEGFAVIPVPRTDFISGNVIALGDGGVLVEQRNVAAAEALSRAGFEVQQLDLSEFVKGTGGPSCLALLVNCVVK